MLDKKFWDFGLGFFLFMRKVSADTFENPDKDEAKSDLLKLCSVYAGFMLVFKM